MKRHVLVLNRSWYPVGAIKLYRAISLLYSTDEKNEYKAKIIEPETYQMLTWQEWSVLPLKEDEFYICSSKNKYKIPEVIILTLYDKLPRSQIHFSKKALFKRDDNKCQFCGIKVNHLTASIDHILPKSKGGKNTFENCCLSCKDCNRKKGDKTLEQSGMKLIKKPVKPSFTIEYFMDFNIPDSWKKFLK